MHSHYRQNFPSGLYYKILQLTQASLNQPENYEGKLKSKHHRKVPMYWQLDHKLLPSLMRFDGVLKMN